MTQLKLRIFHIDDDPFELEEIEKRLASAAVPCEFLLSSFTDRRALFKQLQSRKDGLPPVDILLVDIHLDDDGDDAAGLKIIEDVRALLPEVIVIARSSDMRRVVEAVQKGATDFVGKRSDDDELALRLYTTYQNRRMSRGRPRADLCDVDDMSHGTTLSAITRRIPRIIESAVTTVHLAGETGVGKSMVANAFHATLKPGTPFLTVNCGAITPTLLESELFGHIRGAFTGALTDKIGYLEAASGGWLFLDEIASLSMSAQAALLLAIENQEIIRVGDHKPRKIKTKIISATNENLAELVSAQKFRKDFWQRLCEAEIKIPALRERAGEIATLAAHFCAVAEGGPYRLSSSALEVLVAYDWREGNVRELRNCIRAMTEHHVNKLLTPVAIPERIWQSIDSKPNVSSEDLQGKRPSNAEFHIEFRWDASKPMSFDDLADIALSEYIKQLMVNPDMNSLRKLSAAVGLARSTLTIKLKHLLDRNLLKRTELIALNSKELM